jgi:class 3 adenylate cyclase
MSFSREELAERAGVPEEMVDHLVELGIVAAADDGSFGQPDVYRVRLLASCDRAGMRPEDLAEAVAAGKLSFSFADLPHFRFAAQATTTYRELAEELDLPLDLVLDVERAIGSVRPAPDDRTREDDLAIFQLTKLSSLLVDPEAIVRTSRVFQDALRRITESEVALFDTYVVGAFLQQGMSFVDAVDQANRFGAESTPLQEELLLTLYRRHQERRWTEYTVEGIESVLEDMGLYRKPEHPPAFAFVDLAGYTALTEEQGDLAGARAAADLAHMVDAVSGPRGGEPIKWLGDGVMLRFRDPGDAALAVLELVERAPTMGLPAHAGVAAGSAVFQDGDYFGRTVNLAARIAASASEGQTLVSEEVVQLAEPSALSFRAFGSLELKGFSVPTPVFEAVRR